MKYILCDDCGDLFTSEFATKEEALKEAEKQFKRLTESDLKKRNGFYVLESANPDEEAQDHFDGNVIRDFLKE